MRTWARPQQQEAEKRMVSGPKGGREAGGLLQGNREDSTTSERQFSKSISPRDQASNTHEPVRQGAP